MEGHKFIIRFGNKKRYGEFICIGSRYVNNAQFRLSFFTTVRCSAMGHFRVTGEQMERMVRGDLPEPVENRICKQFGLPIRDAIWLEVQDKEPSLINNS